LGTYSKISIYRILDANLNRATEGIRVCEDIIRFILNDQALTKKCKRIRHQIIEVFSKNLRHKIITERNSKHDVGRILREGEFNRKNIFDVFSANLQRSKESLRVLEECLKLADNKSAVKLKSIRYRVYEVEKAIHQKFLPLFNTQ